MADRPLLIVAAVTPLTDAGNRVDEDAIGPMAAFLASHGADGVFACGTTGEGILLSLDERKRVSAAFREAVSGTLIVHAGAQTTAATVALAAHAAEIGADAVGVIAPPYFPLDVDALVRHFVAGARACAPLPFYCYAFAARSGYALPVDAIERIRAEAENVAGLKVSESPWEKVEPYLRLGLPVFIGSEPLLVRGLRAGAVGAVSGLAAAFPDVVRAALDEPTAAAEARLRDLREAMEAQPFISAAKHVLARRGVPIDPDVRAPLRPLTESEAVTLDDQLRDLGLVEGVASFAH
jgi:dihydrodipicolinate synthase/N-acetylneuraminate lyase